MLGRGFAGDPNEPGGPRDWVPLLYVTHSCFADAALARELLERGADPNAFFVNEYGRMSALYGAAGRVHSPELTRLLLEAGANPDDGESLYHATEAEEPACLELLLEHGAATAGTNALAHALDDERLPHVRALLTAGADPNAFFVNEHGRMSALYGAAGRVHSPELTRLLLEAGADPDDGESLYHATEAEDPACVELLLDHGASTEGTNALAHALDDERLPHVRALLTAGADPSGGAMLAHAVRRGRGPEFLRLLAEHGAELDRPGGETWRGDVPLRTPYQHAVLRGRRESAQTLAELGASTEVAPEDLAVAAVAAGEGPASPLPDVLDPDAQEVLILAALRGSLDAVVEAVGVDFSGVVGGSPEGTLLHHAAWVGSPEVVGALLAGGADPLAGSPETPLAWAVHGSQYWELPGRDYVAVAELLSAAGAPVEPRFVEVADGPLYGWLERRLDRGG